MKTYLIMLAIFFLPLTSYSEMTCRCGKELVTIGDTKVVVKAKCGEPDSVDIEEVEVYTKPQERQRMEKSSSDRHKGVLLTKSTKVIEIWTYNMGVNQFIQILKFADGKLASVETNGYGIGPQRIFPGEMTPETNMIELLDTLRELVSNGQLVILDLNTNERIIGDNIGNIELLGDVIQISLSRKRY